MEVKKDKKSIIIALCAVVFVIGVSLYLILNKKDTLTCSAELSGMKMEYKITFNGDKASKMKTVVEYDYKEMLGKEVSKEDMKKVEESIKDEIKELKDDQGVDASYKIDGTKISMTMEIDKNSKAATGDDYKEFFEKTKKEIMDSAKKQDSMTCK